MMLPPSTEQLPDLTQQVKVYEKTGARGQLGDIARQISEREQLRDQLELDIAKQDAARERIIEIDALLSRMEKELEEKNKRLDAVSGRRKEARGGKKDAGRPARTDRRHSAENGRH